MVLTLSSIVRKVFRPQCRYAGKCFGTQEDCKTFAICDVAGCPGLNIFTMLSGQRESDCLY